MKIILISIFFTFSSLFSFSQNLALSGGPDAYGYTWNRITSAQGAKWVELAGKPGSIDITEKSISTKGVGPINFSFDFPYYWYNRNSLYVGREAYLSFNPITLGAPFEPIASENGQGNDFIAALLASVTADRAGAKVYFWSDFKDSVIVQYQNLGYRGSQGDPQGNVTLEIILARADSSLTFVYASKTGTWGASACVATTPGSVPPCELIGMENVTGKVGLKIAQNNQDEAVWVGISKTNPIAIKIKPTQVLSKNYTTTDLAIAWNNRPGNGGQFVSNSGIPLTMKSKVVNQGTLSSLQAILNGVVKVGSTITSPKKGKTVPPLTNGESIEISLDNNINTNEPGIYGFESEVVVNSSSTDDSKSNNKLKQLIAVVDTTTPSTLLDYTGGEFTGVGISWTYDATKPFNSGNGVYIQPPYYPAKIKAIWFATQGAGNPVPADSIRFQIWDDNGKNIFGKIDGSRGDKLFQKAIGPLDYNFEEYTFTPVPETLAQINSGGVYISELQGGRNTRFKTKPSDNVSYQSFEVTNAGAYNIYRSRTIEDFVLGIEISKGDESQTSNLGILELISPKLNENYSDSVEVKMELINNGNLVIKGPFNVAYKADQRDDVVEVIPSTFTLNIGEKYIYTFKKKAQSPPFPRTVYNNFCATIYPPNDFVTSDNKSCFSNNVGIENKSEVNNFFLYPNPAQNELDLMFGIKENSQVVLGIKSMNGSTVLEKNLGNLVLGMYQEKLDVSALAKGVYLLSIQSNKGLVYKKFIKN